MKDSRLVPFPNPHKHKAEGMPVKIGNTVIIFDTSYIDQLTPEQKEVNMQSLSEAAWSIVDELEARGEAV